MKRRKGTRRTHHPAEVAADALRWSCKPSQLGISSMESVDTVERDYRAGPSTAGAEGGIGDEARRVQHLRHRPARDRTDHHHHPHAPRVCARPATLLDKCYVHNFRDPDSPSMISLPAGQGIAFKKDMETFLNELQKGIPAVFESRRYIEQRKSHSGTFPGPAAQRPEGL